MCRQRVALIGTESAISGVNPGVVDVQGCSYRYALLAETVRFELTNGCPLPVFKTGAIDHSAKSPCQIFSVFLIQL